MRTEEITIYEFHELSEKAKQNAINNWRELDELTFLSDEMEEYLMGDNRFKNTDLLYSLNYCQGDGLSFSCDEFSDEVLLIVFNNVLGQGKEKTARFLVDEFGWIFNTKHNEGRYCFASNSDVKKNDGAWHHDNIDSFLVSVRDSLAEDVYLPKCRKMEKYWYESVEYYSSDDYIEEVLTTNEYEFTEEGEIY